LLVAAYKLDTRTPSKIALPGGRIHLVSFEAQCGVPRCGWYSRVGHGSLFQNPTQPKISGPNPTQPTKVFTRPNATHHRHLVWHIRL